MTINPTVYIHPSAQIMGDVEIGAHSSIWPLAVLRGDMGKIIIGANTSIQDGTVCHATHGLSETRIGDCCTIGHRVILHGCQVEDGCLIGMGSILLDNCLVGKGSLVGAGSLITANFQIPPGSLVMGTPARVIRPLNEREQGIVAAGWPIYVENAKKYMTGV
ncbi:MAG: gamma carbonic anhydrase family protein [Myxococcota bacterium]